MRDKNALRRLENQLNLLYTLGRWTGKTIAERLNKGKLDDIRYTARLVDEENPASVVSSKILIFRALLGGPGSLPEFPVAIIKIYPEASDMPIMPVMEIPTRTRTYLSPEEYQRFLKVMNLIADEMGIPFIEEK